MRGRRLLGGGSIIGAVLVAVAFFQASVHYRGFPQPTYNLVGIPLEEAGSQALYLAFGLPFIALIVAGLHWLGVTMTMERLLVRASRVQRLPVLLVLLVPLGAALTRLVVLKGQSVTDDEEVYLFIARTLLSGRVINPLPPDAEFFQNQFVVLNEHGWFGKYPVGQGLVLALGLATRTIDVVQGLLGGATAAVTYLVGRRLIGPRRALLGLLLLVLSPHFLLTHGTLLSQPALALTLMSATLSILEWDRTGRARFALLSGLLVSAGIVVRPMPGVLFALGPLVVLLRGVSTKPAARRALVLFAGAASLGLIAQALVNLAQSGSALRSGYHEVHHGVPLLGTAAGSIGLSVLGGLWRENFWLFGWPFSLVPVLWARGGRGKWLLWSPVIGELVYRVMVPKTVVSVTGPTYLLEMVPALALLSADGLARVRKWVTRLGPEVAAGVAAVALGATVAGWLFFWPVQLRALGIGADVRGLVWEHLERERAKASKALVFAEFLVPPKLGVSWAYYPPNPSPDLSDEVIFARWPRGVDQASRAREFARRHFPD